MWSFFAHVVEEVGIYGHHFRLARKVFKLVYRPFNTSPPNGEPRQRARRRPVAG